MLSNGLDAFVARAVLAHFAERSIDVQYYLYHDDLVGRLFTHELLKAADRGVLEKFVRQQEGSAYLQALENSSLAQRLRADEVVFYWGEADVIYDLPEKIQHGFDKTEYHLSPQLIPYLKGIEEELVMFSPYFVPGKEGTAFLSDLARRGVRVRILTNSLASNDVSIVHAGYAKYRKDLLRAGVELFEMNKKLISEEQKEKRRLSGSSKASLHAKSFVFDRRQVFIGSLNILCADYTPPIGGNSGFPPNLDILGMILLPPRIDIRVSCSHFLYSYFI